MAKKPKPPILPGNNRDPTGVDRLERGAMREFKKRIKSVSKIYIQTLEQIPSNPVVNARYVFQLDQGLLSTLLRNAERLVDGILLQGGELNLWFFQRYVSTAYQRGTAQEFANLYQQSLIYAAHQQSMQNIVISDAYQRRMALVRARVFEEMNGLTAGIRADMARVLSDGIARGLNPNEIAKQLTAQAGIESRRANRIARTEITTALRRARMDESEYAEDELGVRTKQLHLSALSPTTRHTHAERHGRVFTRDEQREWWSEDANSINCKCSTISVLIDSNGDPISKKLIERARKQYITMKYRGLTK